jgi:hypothetical protein
VLVEKQEKNLCAALNSDLLAVEGAVEGIDSYSVVGR